VSDLKYEQVPFIDRQQLLRDLENPDPEIVATALYAAYRSESDTPWLEQECLSRLSSPMLRVRWAAATCLGDLAFFRHPLDLKKVIPALEAAISDPTISDPASFSLSMVKEFLAR